MDIQNVFDDLDESDIKKIHELQDILEDFRLKFKACNYTYDREKFFNLMKEFWGFISNYKDERTYKLFEHSEYYAKYRNYFASLENYHIRTIESIETVSILTQQVQQGTSFLNVFDKKLAKETYLQTNRDLQLVDIDNCKRLVMVGCGPLPETILYIYENTDIEEIIGLDNNQEAIYMAGELIRAQGIDRIKLLHYNGVDYDYSKADIVYVANFVQEKKAIFQRIADTVCPTTQILTRTPVLFGRMLYEDTLNALNLRLSLVKEGDINNYFLWKPIVLEKLDI